MKTKPIIRLTSILLITAAILFACKELDLTRQMLINTLEVTDITTESVLIQGEIKDLGEGITDHGFYYHTSPNAQNGEVYSLGSSNATGSFATQLENLTQYQILCKSLWF
jgi:hypothetical protein